MPRIIPHEEWLPGMPGTDPAGRPYELWRPQSDSQPLNAPGADRVRGSAIHWPGSGPGTSTYAFAERDPVGYVRSIHRNHRNRKPSGFDIGYGFVVVPNGDIYGGREWYRQAAHGGDDDPGDENEQYLAIQLPVDNLRPHPDPSPQQIASVRWLIEEQRRRYPGANEISDHQTVDGPGNTSCPGPVLHRMVFDGTFEPTGEAEEMPLTDDEFDRIAAQTAAKVWAEIISGPPGGLGPANAEQTIFEIRTMARKLPGIETNVKGLVTATEELKDLLEQAGSPDLVAIEAAMKRVLEAARYVVGT